MLNPSQMKWIANPWTDGAAGEVLVDRRFLTTHAEKSQAEKSDQITEMCRPNESTRR